MPDFTHFKLLFTKTAMNSAVSRSIKKKKKCKPGSILFIKKKKTNEK